MSDWGYSTRGPLYADMSFHQWCVMLEVEDPDDRAIREAHGIGYDADYLDEGVKCQNGCGLSYPDISSGKIRKCEAAVQ